MHFVCSLYVVYGCILIFFFLFSIVSNCCLVFFVNPINHCVFIKYFKRYYCNLHCKSFFPICQWWVFKKNYDCIKENKKSLLTCTVYTMLKIIFKCNKLQFHEMSNVKTQKFILSMMLNWRFGVTSRFKYKKLLCNGILKIFFLFIYCICSTQYFILYLFGIQYFFFQHWELEHWMDLIPQYKW